MNLISIKNLKLRAVTEFLILAVILGFATHCAYLKIDSLLKNSLEESVALTSRSIAVGLNNQFEQKLSELQTRAFLLQKNEISESDLIGVLKAGKKGRTIGILDSDKKIVAGDFLSDEEIKILEPIFNGEKIIKYTKKYGLIFAIPFEMDGQTYAMFEKYNDEAIRKKFHAESYNGSGTVVLLNSYYDWMVISDGEELINTDPGMDENWAALMKKFEKNPDDESWSIFGEFKGKRYFLYLADISRKYHFAISGYVSWEKAAVGIDYIYKVMLAGIFLAFLCLIFAVRYVMKTRQAKYLEKEKDFFEHEKLLADSANKAKSSFLSNMSHEIRTPINAIMGMNEMVIRETEDKNILEYSENLQNAAKTLLGLVNDILDFSKIEAGKMEIIPVEYHLSSVLNDLVNMIETRAEKKGLKFIIQADKNLPSVLYGDEIRIKQIITNILTNAVKYTEKGSVTLEVKFSEADDENISLKISVVDTGIGIKEEDISKLFSAFERIEEKRNRSIEGTGLGMNITQKLLSMMNSKLNVQSIYGEGSNFSFEILQKVVSREPIGDFQENYHQSLSQRKKYQKTFTAPDAKILVVDDTPMNLTVVKGLLKPTKIQIETAENGYECLNLVTKKIYDIIFLDHKMPGLDGIETLQEMKKLPNNLNENTPIISLTANAISGAREEYISAGFNDYLTKPIDSAKLEKLLLDYLPSEKISEENPAVKISEEKISDSEKLPEFLKGVDGLNTAAGIEHCGGLEPYLEVLKVFAEAINSGAAEIENYFDNEDWKNYTTKVHALKSTAKVIGADELSERAKNLEDAGNSGDLDEIKNLTPELLKLYKSYAEKLSSFLEVKEDDSNKPQISDEELAEAYETLKEIAANFDYDSLNFVLQSLEEYKLPDSEKEKFNQLKDAAAKLDWEKISAQLNK